MSCVRRSVFRHFVSWTQTRGGKKDGGGGGGETERRKRIGGGGGSEMGEVKVWGGGSVVTVVFS